MKIEWLLDFSADAAIQELSTNFAAVIEDLCQTVLANASANLGSQYDEVRASLTAGLVDLATTGIITGQISAVHWESWIAEWGSGSEMDMSNPDLPAYMASEYWNPVRDGLAITGRAQGSYVSLAGETHSQSAGTLAGRNLEVLSQYSWFQEWLDKVGITDPNAFHPRVPLHFMRNALESNRVLIIDQLNAVLEVFSFSKFFV